MRFSYAFTCLIILLLFGASHATIQVYFANMTASQVMGSASTATGTGIFFFDDVSLIVSYYVIHNVQNIVGAHFHAPAAPGSEANIIFALSNTNAITGQLQALTAQQQQWLTSEQWYILIHSQTYPAGEIRGQLYLNTNITYASILNTNGVPYKTTDPNAFGVVVFAPATSGSTNDFWVTAQQGVSDASAFGVYGPAPNCATGDQLVGWGTGTSQQVSRLTLSTDQATNLGKGLLYTNSLDSSYGFGVIRGQILPVASAQTLPDCVWATTGAPGAVAGGPIDSTTVKNAIIISVTLGVAAIGVVFVIILAIILYCAYRRRQRAKKQTLLGDNRFNKSQPQFPKQVNYQEMQGQLASQAQLIFEHFKQNKFDDTILVANEMENVAKEHGPFIPNPSVIFFILVKVFKKPEFRHCDANYMHRIISLLHMFAGLTLIEKVGKGLKLAEQEKNELLENIQTLMQMTRGNLNIELRYQLDCIRQCVVLMEDTGRSVIILSRAMGLIQQPMAMIPMIIQEVDNFPTNFYFRMLTTRQVLSKAKKDEQVCHELLTLGFQKKKTTDWHVFYDQAIMLGEIAKEGSTLNICCLAVTGQPADYNTEIHIDVGGEEVPVTSLTKLMGCDFLHKVKHNSWVKIKAIEETLKIVNCDKADHVVRKEALMALFTRRVMETDEQVKKVVESSLNSLQQEDAFSNWKNTIQESSEDIVRQIDTEWEELLTLKQTLYQKRTDLEERRRVISSSDLELNLMKETYRHDLEDEQYQEQVSMMEEFQAQQRQIEKQEKYATNSDEIQDNIRKRVQVQRAMSTMNRNLIDNIERSKSSIQKLEGILERSKLEISELSQEVEDLKDKYEKAREQFETKRRNFETIQSDYHLGLLLQVQDLERKMNTIERPEFNAMSEGTPVTPASKPVTTPSSATKINNTTTPSNATKGKSRETSSVGISDSIEEEIPNGFTCPITGDIMKNPVIVAESGHTYEKAAIERWFSSHDTDPMTGAQLSSKMLINNFNLKKIIDEWKQAQKKV